MDMDMVLLNSRLFLHTVSSILLTYPSFAWSAQWAITPSLLAGEVYSDNINLSSSNKESDLITQVNPRINILGEGSQLELQVDYVLQNLIYAENNEKNKTIHQLYEKANGELIRESLFIDLESSITQQPISTQRGSSTDNISGSDNLSDIYTLLLSPYWRPLSNNFAETEFRYTYDQVEADNTQFIDSQSDKFVFTINSGKQFNSFTLGAEYDSQAINFDDNININHESISARLGYHFSSRTNVFWDGGYENNDFSGEGIGNDPDDFFWSIGGSWSPTRRTDLALLYGHKFFGDTYGFQFDHYTRRINWYASYNETFTNIRQQIIENIINTRILNFERDSSLVNDKSLFTPSELLPSLSNETFVTKDANIGMFIRTSKSVIKLRIFNHYRIFQSIDSTEEDIGINTSWAWNLAPRTTSEILAGWTKFNFNNESLNAKELQTSWQILRKVSPITTASLLFARIERNSENGINEFIENRIKLTIEITF